MFKEEKKVLLHNQQVANFWHLQPQEILKAEHGQVQNQSRQICEQVHKQTSKQDPQMESSIPL